MPVSEEPRYRNGSSLASPRLLNISSDSDSFYAPKVDYYSSGLDEDDCAFWCFPNCQNWHSAPSVTEHERRKEVFEARDAARMADPFEVRMRFSAQLQHLNASVVSAQKAAQYALKHKEMSEDLHSCILEQMERNSMNTRANIMYFIEPFLELADKERSVDYIRRMQRDIIRVVDAVCPEDGSGAANVKVVRKVLQGLNSKGFLLDQTVAEIEDCLKDRAAVAHAELGLSSPANGADADKTGTAPGSGVAGGDLQNGPKSTRNGPLKLEKRQIEQRIEEDRERHKKRREHIWLVPLDEGEKKLKLWEDGSDAGDDDSRMAGEEGDDLENLEEYKRGHEDDRNGAANGGLDHQGTERTHHEIVQQRMRREHVRP